MKFCPKLKNPKKAQIFVAWDSQWVIIPGKKFRKKNFGRKFWKIFYSDTTYGWNGYMNGLTIYYMHPSEDHQADEHCYPVVPGLTPIIFLQNIQIELLGKPYTGKEKITCQKTNFYKENKENIGPYLL